MIRLANDKYRATLRAGWTASPADTTLSVTAIPTNVPTQITVAWETDLETVFDVTGTSGTNSSNYALTGVTRVKGANVNLPENATVNCLNNEDYFNQYSDILAEDFIRLDDESADPDTPSSGKALFYIKNGKPFVIDDAGTVAEVGFKSDAWIDVADAASMEIDLSETIKRLKYLVGPLTDNRAFTVTGASEGQVFMLRIMQDGTGSRTVTWFPVTTDTVTITLATPGVITTTKDIKTGTPVKFTTTGALPTGITASTRYFWIRTGATTGNIATSKANAIAGTAVATSVSQSGTHTMSVQIVWAGGDEPTLTTSKNAYDDFGFVVHDANTITGTVIAQDI